MFIMQEDQISPKVMGTKQKMLLPEVITALLERFQHLFEEPKQLPPHRTHDHCIPLEESVKGVSIRPYRYSSTHKDVIEGMIMEMLHGGLIQPSNSPFSSPVVLVKKKDNS